jgi:glutamate---cysteine ligase / carboxylate-amine ligase
VTWPSSEDELRARFEEVTPYEVGLEDELMLIDPESLELADRAEEVLARLRGDARFKPELPASQVEIVIPPHRSVTDAAAALLDARRALAAATEGLIRPAAAGAHPFSPGVGKLNAGERYQRIAETYGCIAQRELVGALQVHVSVGDPDLALSVYNAARSYLPQLAALAANAPFYEGEDSGFASVRPLIATLLPRQGVPPAFETFSDYARALAWGSASRAFPDPGTWWWELRLHGGFGTLEFRVPDAQSTVGEAAALTAVIQALVVWLSRRHADGREPPVHPRWMIEQNRWSACRHGVEGSMVDLTSGERCSTRTLLASLLGDLQEVADELQLQGELALAAEMVGTNGAISQRAVAEAGGAGAVAQWLAERFLDTSVG